MTEQKELKDKIEELENQIDQLNFRYEQLSASKLFFSDKLIESINEKKDAEESEVVGEPTAEQEG